MSPFHPFQSLFNRPIGIVLLTLVRVVIKGLASILLTEFALLGGLVRGLSLLGNAVIGGSHMTVLPLAVR